jgi:hypothetical protein
MSRQSRDLGLERPEVKLVERALPSVKQEVPPSIRWSSSHYAGPKSHNGGAKKGRL